ncbi:hypothetical protein TNCV_1385851 [Trichonephila clavipes]|nr:hypothetical protein TNCV_1385851 [Trichonephila clavipes]
MLAGQVPPPASWVVAVVQNESSRSFSRCLRGSVGDKVLECSKHCANCKSLPDKIQTVAIDIKRDVYWDRKGILHIDFLPRGGTVNADRYCRNNNVECLLQVLCSSTYCLRHSNYFDGIWLGAVRSSKNSCSPTFDLQPSGAAVVKVSDHGRHVTSSSPVPLKTHRNACEICQELKRPPVGVVW